jgi:hypothetical protein
MENDAGNSAPLMESEPVTLSIKRPEDEEGRTIYRTVSGDVPIATENAITPDQPGPLLSEQDELRLATIRKNWNRGWLPLFEECKFLLEIVERITNR